MVSAIKRAIEQRRRQPSPNDIIIAKIKEMVRYYPRITITNDMSAYIFSISQMIDRTSPRNMFEKRVFQEFGMVKFYYEFAIKYLRISISECEERLENSQKYYDNVKYLIGRN